jgi:hypothetical protein
MVFEEITDLVSEEARASLGLPVVSQVGYVVEDVYLAIEAWRNTHGKGPWLVLDHDHPLLLLGKSTRSKLRIGLAYEGPLQIELIQVLEGETIHRGAAREQSRIHHLGFNVRDLGRRLEYCQRQGAKMLQRGTIRSAGMTVNYAYFEATSIGSPDLILELIEWRLGILPIPASRLLFSTLLTLGAWNVFRGKVVR